MAKSEQINSSKYILVTPVKNEETSIACCVQSILEQTVRPILWLIVDDGSTDKTPAILNDIVGKYQWIRIINLAECERDLGIHYSFVCKIGFNCAIECCIKHKKEYDFVGLMDADIVLENVFFETLLTKFKENPSLGIASGSTWYMEGDKTIYAKQSEDLPSGAARLWRRKCFEETSGYQLTQAADSISNIKAKLRGWDIRRFEDVKAIQTRMTGGATGLWAGWIDVGKRAHYVGVGIFFALFKSIRYLLVYPYYIGFAYFVGYLKSYILKKKKIDDSEILYYYGHVRPINWMKEIIKKVM